MLRYVFFCLCIVFSSSFLQAQNITTYAGTGSPGFSGDGGAATAAQLNTPYGVAADTAGNVYIADNGNNRIRKISTSGIITTIAGSGTSGFSGDGGQATAAALRGPRGVAVDKAGTTLIFSDYGNNCVRQVNLSTGVISTIVNTARSTGFSGDGSAATAAKTFFVWGVTLTDSGKLLIADDQNCRVRQVNTSGIISTICGTGTCFSGGDGGAAIRASIQYPKGVAVDPMNNIYIADDGNNRVRKINASGTISTITGSPTYGFSGDGGPATAAKVYYPRAVASDDSGRVYIADMTNQRIRMINTAGIINTIAGNGTMGFGGDNGPATAASLYEPTGVVVVSTKQKIYICDNNNHRIRVMDTTMIPEFLTPSGTVASACAGMRLDVTAPLTVYDRDPNQPLTWTLIAGPYNGTASIAYSTTSTGATIVPSGLFYTATAGYVGRDSIKVVVCDGIYFDTTVVVFNVSVTATAGTIVGIDSICPGDTALFRSTMPGGRWYSGDTTIATIGLSSGVLTGVRTGTDTITYIYDNACGYSATKKVIRVRVPTGTCNVSVTDINSAANEQLIAYPNPTDGAVVIKLSSASNETYLLTIVDAIGNLVMKQPIVANKLQDIILNVPTGVYYLRATGATRHFTTTVGVVR